MNKLTRYAVRLSAVAIALGLLHATAGTAEAAAGTDRLNPGETLGAGARLVSANGQFVLTMQSDGNLVEYAAGNRAVWATGTARGGSVARMQTDGNLVVIAPGNVPVWATGTSGNPNATLEVQNDGNIVVYATGHIARWASGGRSSLGDRIASIARGEAANPARNRERGNNCNFYSGDLGAGTACGGRWAAEAWCADFARWVWRQAGANTGGLTAGAISFQRYGTAHGTWHAGSALDGVQPGDVIGHNFGGATSNDHVGVVVAVSPTTVTTVDGNYANAVTTRTLKRGTTSVSGYTRPAN